MIAAQIGIGLAGVAAIALSQASTDRTRRWACIFGLLAQPAWMYETWTAGQYPIFALTFAYTLSWLKGFRYYWLGRQA